MSRSVGGRLSERVLHRQAAVGVDRQNVVVSRSEDCRPQQVIRCDGRLGGERSDRGPVALIAEVRSAVAGGRQRVDVGDAVVEVAAGIGGVDAGAVVADHRAGDGQGGRCARERLPTWSGASRASRDRGSAVNESHVPGSRLLPPSPGTGFGSAINAHPDRKSTGEDANALRKSHDFALASRYADAVTGSADTPKHLPRIRLRQTEMTYIRERDLANLSNSTTNHDKVRRSPATSRPRLQLRIDSMGHVNPEG